MKSLRPIRINILYGGIIYIYIYNITIHHEHIFHVCIIKLENPKKERENPDRTCQFKINS